jgi:hypothetical protein
MEYTATIRLYGALRGYFEKDEYLVRFEIPEIKIRELMKRLRALCGAEAVEKLYSFDKGDFAAGILCIIDNKTAEGPGEMLELPSEVKFLKHMPGG